MTLPKMIVSEPKKVILIEIPGVGCDALTQLIEPYVVDSEGKNESKHINNRYSRFAESLPLLTRLGKEPKEYFKIVAVRNPYHRLINIWQNYYQSPRNSVNQNLISNLRFTFARHTGLNPFPAQEFHQMYADGDFPSFVAFLDYILTKFRLDIARKYIGAADQYSYIENDLWNEFDYIASWETLKLDLAKIHQQLDLKGLEIPNVSDKNLERNLQEQQDFLEYYDEETLKTVNRLFIRDFVYFGYKQLSLFELNQSEKQQVATI